MKGKMSTVNKMLTGDNICRSMVKNVLCILHVPLASDGKLGTLIWRRSTHIIKFNLILSTKKLYDGPHPSFTHCAQLFERVAAVHMKKTC